VVADTRTCEQCGASFVPRREHARFCSPACRAAWNSEHAGDLNAGPNTLQWSITAMNDTIERLSQVTAWDRPRAFAVIGEAVWWVTIVDATLARHHLDAYDGVMAGQAPPSAGGPSKPWPGSGSCATGSATKPTLPSSSNPLIPAPDSDDRHIQGWTWKQVSEPKLTSPVLRGQAWEMTRYQAYQAQLAGHAIEETFARDHGIPQASRRRCACAHRR